MMAGKIRQPSTIQCDTFLSLRLFWDNMVFQVRAELDEDEISGQLWVIAEHLFQTSSCEQEIKTLLEQPAKSLPACRPNSAMV